MLIPVFDTGNQKSNSGNFSGRREALEMNIQTKHEQSQTHPFEQEGSPTPNLRHSALHVCQSFRVWRVQSNKKKKKKKRARLGVDSG